MSTHADAIREAERAVVEAVGALRRQCDLPVDDYRRLGGNFDEPIARGLICYVLQAQDALLALRAATCPECDGSGEILVREGDGGIVIGRAPCPTNCERWRRREP